MRKRVINQMNYLIPKIEDNNDGTLTITTEAISHAEWYRRADEQWQVKRAAIEAEIAK